MSEADQPPKGSRKGKKPKPLPEVPPALPPQPLPAPLHVQPEETAAPDEAGGPHADLPPADVVEPPRTWAALIHSVGTWILSWIVRITEKYVWAEGIWVVVLVILSLGLARLFGLDPRSVSLGTLGAFACFMLVAVVKVISRIPMKHLTIHGHVLVWFCIAAFILVTGAITLGMVSDWPLKLKHWIEGRDQQQTLFSDPRREFVVKECHGADDPNLPEELFGRANDNDAMLRQWLRTIDAGGIKKLGVIADGDAELLWLITPAFDNNYKAFTAQVFTLSSTKVIASAFLAHKDENPRFTPLPREKDEAAPGRFHFSVPKSRQGSVLVVSLAMAKKTYDSRPPGRAFEIRSIIN
jgi:hypothetical protein